VAQLIQSDADGACCLCIEEECSQFSFSGTGNNLLHDLAQDMEGPIVWQCRISGSGCSKWPGAEEVVASIMGATLGG